MTNYLDKEGLKKFWEITKGKYSVLGHNHDDRYLKIGATAANSDKLGGFSKEQVLETMTRRDFVYGTLVKTSIPFASSNPFLLEVKGNGYYNGLVNFMVQGYIFRDKPDLPLYIVNPRAICYVPKCVDRVKICSINGYLCFWWGRQGYWQGFNITCKLVLNAYAENKVTSVLDTEEPNADFNLFVTPTDAVTTGTIGDFIPTNLSQLTDDVVKGKYLPLSGGTLSGSIGVTADNAFVRAGSSNGDVKLYASTNRGLFDATTSKWIVATIKANNNTMMMNGNVGINTMEPDSRLHVNGTLHSTGASTLDSTLTVGGAATLNSSLTVKGATTLNGKLNVNGDVLVNESNKLTVGQADGMSFVNIDNYTITVQDNADDFFCVVGQFIDYQLAVYPTKSFTPETYALFGVSTQWNCIEGHFNRNNSAYYIIDEDGFTICKDVDTITSYGSHVIKMYEAPDSDWHSINIPNKNGTLALDVDLAKYLPLSGGTVQGNLYVNGGTSVQNLIVNGVLTTKGNGLELYHATPFIDFHYGNSASDYNVRIRNNVSGGIQIEAPTLIDLVGPMKSSGGRLWITNGNTNIYDVKTTGLMSYVPVEHLSTSQLVGNVGIGTAPDAAYKLKVNGKAYFSANALVNGDLQVNGEIHNGNFKTDMDGWTFTPHIEINEYDGLIISDNEGVQYTFDVEKAKELGLLT